MPLTEEQRSQLYADPEFHALSETGQGAVLRQLDPEFEAMQAPQQTTRLGEIKSQRQQQFVPELRAQPTPDQQGQPPGVPGGLLGRVEGLSGRPAPAGEPSARGVLPDLAVNLTALPDKTGEMVRSLPGGITSAARGAYESVRESVELAPDDPRDLAKAFKGGMEEANLATAKPFILGGARYAFGALSRFSDNTQIQREHLPGYIPLQMFLERVEPRVKGMEERLARERAEGTSAAEVGLRTIGGLPATMMSMITGAKTLQLSKFVTDHRVLTGLTFGLDSFWKNWEHGLEAASKAFFESYVAGHGVGAVSKLSRTAQPPAIVALFSGLTALQGGTAEEVIGTGLGMAPIAYGFRPPKGQGRPEFNPEILRRSEEVLARFRGHKAAAAERVSLETGAQARAEAPKPEPAPKPKAPAARPRKPKAPPPAPEAPPEEPTEPTYGGLKKPAAPEPEAPVAREPVKPETVGPREPRGELARDAADFPSLTEGDRRGEQGTRPRMAEKLERDLNDQEETYLALVESGRHPSTRSDEVGYDFLQSIVGSPDVYKGAGLRAAQEALRSRGDLDPEFHESKGSGKQPSDLRDVGIAASKDETRYNLNQVHVEKDRIVSTDGHRLHILEGPHDLEPGAYTLPKAGKRTYRRDADQDQFGEFPNIEHVFKPHELEGAKLSLTSEEAGALFETIKASRKRYGFARSGNAQGRIRLPNGQHINMAYLLESMEAARAQGDGSIELLLPRDPHKPFYLRSLGGTAMRFTAEIMPMGRGRDTDPEPTSSLRINWFDFAAETEMAPFLPVASGAKILGKPFDPKVEAALRDMPDSEGRALLEGLGRQEKPLTTRQVAALTSGRKAPTKAEVEFTKFGLQEMLKEGLVEQTGTEKSPKWRVARAKELPAQKMVEQEDLFAPRETQLSVGEPGEPGALHRPKQDVPILPPDAPIPRGLVRRSAILQSLAKSMHTTINFGRLRTHGKKLAEDVGGVYKPFQGVFRVKRWGDLQAASHELGHMLVDRYESFSRLVTQEIPAELRQELESISYDRNEVSEGLAEGMRLWATQDAYLRENAPRVHAEIEVAIGSLPKKAQRALRRAKKDMHRWYEQGAEKALEDIRGPQPGAKETLLNAGDSFRQTWVDDMHAVLASERDIYKGKQQASGAYETMRSLRGVNRLVDQLWDVGAPMWVKDARGNKTGDIDLVGKGIFQILAPVARSQKELKTAESYFVARMAKEMAGQVITKAGRVKTIAEAREAGELEGAKSREQLVTKNMIEAGMRLETPARKKAFDDMVEFNKRVADFGQAAGLFSAKQRGNWRRDQYAFGLFREMGLTRKKRSLSDPLIQGQGVYTARGSSRALRDPMDSIIAGPSRIVQLALENQAKGKLARMLEAEGGGRWGQRIKAESKKTLIYSEVMKDQIVRELKRAGVDEEMIESVEASMEQMPELISLYMGGQKPYGAEVMSYLVNGKPRYYDLFDPALQQSVSMMRREPLNKYVSLFLDRPRRFLQGMITSNPRFMLGQIVRDPLMRNIQTRTGLVEINSTLRGYYHALTKSPEFRQRMANLGGGGSIREPSVRARRKEVIRYARLHGKGTEAVPYKTLEIIKPKNLWRMLDHIGRSIEEGPRMGEFLAAKGKKAATRRRAAFLSREVTTDFSQMGAGSFARVLASSIPFYRAMIASADRMYRANVRDPNYKFATAAKFSMLVGLSAAHYMMIRDQDWFKDLPRHVRDGYWIFPPINLGTQAEPDMYLPRLPRLWEYGAVAGATEYLLEDMLNSDDPYRKRFGEDLGRLIVRNFGIGYPVVAEVLLEQYSNRTSFTGVAVEPIGERRLDPFYRTRASTPQLLRDFGKATRNVPVVKKYASPARTDAFLTTLLGSWWMYGAQVADAALYEGLPERGLEHGLLSQRVLMREGQYNKVRQEWYEFLQSANQGAATYRRAMELEDNDIADEYGDREDVLSVSGIGRQQKAIRGMDDDIEEVKRDPGMTPKEKRDAIQNITIERDELMKEGLELFRPEEPPR